MNSSNIEVGSIVKIVNAEGDRRGYYRIRSIRGRFANLGSIFGRDLYHKSVPLTELVECKEEWYAAWQKTESYQCM